MLASIVFAVCFVSCVSAGHLGGYGAPLAGPINSGQSSQFREEDSYGNYKFGYDESSATGGSGRREKRHGDVVRGSYNLAVADGRDRRVDYIADAAGFRATIHTNEPGVDSSRDPAAVLINEEAHAPVAIAAPVYASKGYTVQAPIAAPVYEAPREAFSYSFGTTHPAPVYATAQAPLPLSAPVPASAPIYQHGPGY